MGYALIRFRFCCHSIPPIKHTLEPPCPICDKPGNNPTSRLQSLGMDIAVLSWRNSSSRSFFYFTPEFELNPQESHGSSMSEKCRCLQMQHGKENWNAFSSKEKLLFVALFNTETRSLLSIFQPPDNPQKTVNIPHLDARIRIVIPLDIPSIHVLQKFSLVFLFSGPALRPDTER